MAQGKQLEELFESLKNKNIVKTKQEYCNLMNIDYKSFSRLLRDELNYPINQTNYEVLKKLDINIEWFITGNGSMFNESKYTSQGNDARIRELEAEIKRLESEIATVNTENHRMVQESMGYMKKLLEVQDQLLRLKGV